MSDLYQVVDNKDKLVGLKERNKIDFMSDYYRVSALWLTNSSGQVLIAQRLMIKDKDPGKWGPAAAGTLEEGETYETNVYKEAEEEIGLAGITFKPGPKFKMEEPRRYFCQIYVGICDKSETEFVPQPTEVEQVKWVDKNWLANDVKTNPNNYVPSMPTFIDDLISLT